MNDDLEDDFLLDDNRTGSEITPKIMKDLKTTSVWLRYLGILGFVSAAVALIFLFVGMFTMMGVYGNSHRYPTEYFIGIFVAVVMLMMTIYMSILMFQYGNGIKQFFETGKYFALEEAFEKQKVYWTVAGVFMTIIVGLYVISFLFGLSK